MNISTPYPIWYLTLCLVVGIAVSWWLYRKNKIPFEPQQKWQLYLLSAFRFISVTIICLLLFNPLLQTENSYKEKPLVVVAIDNSQSIIVNKDSIVYRTVLVPKIKELAKELGENYEVKYLTFGEKISEGNNIVFNEKQSDYSLLISSIYSRYENNNIGALILAGDGLYNKGVNPVYEAQNYKFPVYTLALGDTNFQKDFRIRKIKHNEIAYLGNTFPININIAADGYINESGKVSVSHLGKEIFQKSFTVSDQNFSIDIPVVIEANQSGVQRYTVTINRLQNEVSYINNTSEFVVDVLDGKQKILVAALSPHPDLGALKKSIESNKNYETKLVYANEIQKTGDLKQYNLIIFHQIPGSNNSLQTLLNNTRQLSIPSLFIAGSQTNYSLLSAYLGGLKVVGTSYNDNDATPSLNIGFSLFSLSDNLKNKIGNFPPLKSPFGSYINNGSYEILATQKIGYVNSTNPLIGLSKGTSWRTGVVFGDGLWRWRLADFNLNKNYETFDELLNKTIQYLGVKTDLRRFRLVNFKNTILENEALQMDAEVYNASYELDNKNDVEIQLTNSVGKQFQYTFSKTNNAYTLNAGILPSGVYTYTAKTTIDGKVETLTGSIAIQALQNELGETVANHHLLNQLSANTGGKMYYPAQLDQLINQLKANESIKPVIYKERETTDLINLKTLFFIMLIFLFVEWLVRKMNGVV